MAWNELETTSKTTGRNRNSNNRGCTKSKCALVTFALIAFAALVACYIGLVCQDMDLLVVDATISAFNVTNASVPSPPRRTSASVNASVPQLRHATDITANSSHNASAINSSFYLSEVAITLSLLVKNPTPSMGTYHYHQLNWQLFYHNMTIAKGSIRPFSQGPHHAHSPIQLHLKGANIALPHTIASDLQMNRRVLNLQASTTAYVQLLGKFVDYEFPVNCDLNFPHPTNGKAHLHSKTSCTVKAG